MTKFSNSRIRPYALVLCLGLGLSPLAACAAEPAVEHKAHAAAGQSAQHHPAPPAITASLPPATMKQIAAEAGCPDPALQIDADELRQAACQTSRGRYTIATFTTEKGKLDWLESAQAYGGNYLIGRRWVVIAPVDLLKGLQTGLGGQIQEVHH